MPSQYSGQQGSSNRQSRREHDGRSPEAYIEGNANSSLQPTFLQGHINNSSQFSFSSQNDYVERVPQDAPIPNLAYHPNHIFTSTHAMMGQDQPYMSTTPNYSYPVILPDSLGSPAPSYPMNPGNSWGSSAMPGPPTAIRQLELQNVPNFDSSPRAFSGYTDPQSSQGMPYYYYSPPYGTASPHGSPQSSASTSSHVIPQNQARAPPAMVPSNYFPAPEMAEICRWDNCYQIVRVTGTSTDLLKALKSHFDRFHNYAGLNTCGWEGCICKRVARDSCHGRGMSHPAHVRKLWVHIYRVHLHHLSALQAQSGDDSFEFPGSPSSSAA